MAILGCKLIIFIKNSNRAGEKPEKVILILMYLY